MQTPVHSQVEVIMISAIGTALNAIHAHLDSLDRTAARIARREPEPDLPGEMVRMMIDKRGVQANAATIRAADAMTGTLIDILA
jgi:hypothetical protein